MDILLANFMLLSFIVPCSQLIFALALDQTKEIAEGGVCTRLHADDVPPSVMHSCVRSA